LTKNSEIHSYNSFPATYSEDIQSLTENHTAYLFNLYCQGTSTFTMGLTAQLYLEGNGVCTAKMHHSTTWTTCMCHYSIV